MPQNLPLFPSKAASLGNNAPNQPLFPSEAAGGCVIMIDTFHVGSWIKFRGTLLMFIFLSKYCG